MDKMSKNKPRQSVCFLKNPKMMLSMGLSSSLPAPLTVASPALPASPSCCSSCGSSRARLTWRDGVALLEDRGQRLLGVFF